MFAASEIGGHGRTLVCRKSAGHTGSQYPNAAAHDPSADERWSDDKEKR
jgi:hypothetical protein